MTGTGAQRRRGNADVENEVEVGGLLRGGKGEEGKGMARMGMGWDGKAMYVNVNVNRTLKSKLSHLPCFCCYSAHLSTRGVPLVRDYGSEGLFPLLVGSIGSRRDLFGFLDSGLLNLTSVHYCGQSK